MAGVPDDMLEQFWDRLPAATLNQCEHLLINGIGKALLRTGIDPLVFETGEHMQLIAVLLKATEERLMNAANLLCQWLGLIDENAKRYVFAIIPQLTMWIESNPNIGNLDSIFV